MTVDELGRELAEIGRVYLASDPERLRPRVDAARSAALRAADEATSTPERREARRLSGWLEGVLASLAHTTGDRAEAQRRLRTAMATADDTGDDALRLWVRSQEALMEDHDGTGPPLGQTGDEDIGPPSFAGVRLLALRARAAAGRGDAAAAAATLARAWALLAALPPAQRGGGLFGYPEEKLASVEGDVWLRLQEPQRARRALERSLRAYDEAEGDRRSVIDQALVRLKLGMALAALGLPDQAAVLGEQALALDPERRFTSVGLRAGALADALAGAPASAEVRRFRTGLARHLGGPPA